MAKWRHPTGSIVKINFDGVFEKERCRLCSGIIARNAHDEVPISRAVIHPNVGSPFAAEAIACLWVANQLAHVLATVSLKGEEPAYMELKGIRNGRLEMGFGSLEAITVYFLKSVGLKAQFLH
ncbi:hypothetical protein GOBAR_DD27548 [Gossypium barbadense]|nr:hypothetical protein GOBAR_DD27548 [Gossypium barbadense]